MDPRLKSSTQWSPFPIELCEHMQSALSDRFGDEYDLENAHFVVEGRIFPEEIIGRYGLQVQGQLKQHNFEVSMDFDSEKEKALEVIQNSMDVVEHLWTELLEDDLDDTDLSKKWQSLTHEKKLFHYRYSTVNTSLEAEADKLLEQYKKKLVYDSSETPEPSDDKEKKDTHTLH